MGSYRHEPFVSSGGINVAFHIGTRGGLQTKMWSEKETRRGIVLSGASIEFIQMMDHRVCRARLNEIG